MIVVCPDHTHLLFSCCLLKGDGYVVVDSLFVVAAIVCLGLVFGPCFVMQYLVSFLMLQSSN